MEERELGDGFTTNSNLYITVYEAKDLNSSSLISDCDAFVILNFDGKTQQTLIKKSTNNPAWNENFKFPVRKKDLVLRIEVFDHSIMGSKLIGYVPIPLNSFINQEKNINWFDLHLGPPGSCERHKSRQGRNPGIPGNKTAGFPVVWMNPR